MKQYLIALFALLIVALAVDIVLLRRQAQLRGQLESAQSRLAALEKAQESVASREARAAADNRTVPEPETTPAPEQPRLTEPFEHFVAEQRKVYAYLMAKVDYLIDTARMLEVLALLGDAPPQERRRLQFDLDDALNKRERSKEEFEEATRKFYQVARQFVEDEKDQAPRRIQTAPQAVSPAP